MDFKQIESVLNEKCELYKTEIGLVYILPDYPHEITFSSLVLRPEPHITILTAKQKEYKPEEVVFSFYSHTKPNHTQLAQEFMITLNLKDLNYFWIK